MQPFNYNLAYSPLRYSPTFSPTTPDSPATPEIYGDPGDPFETTSTQEEYGEASSDSEESIRNPKKRTFPPQNIEGIDPDSISQAKRRKVESIKAPRSEEVKKLVLPNLRSQIEKLFNEKIQLSLQSAYFLGTKRLSLQEFTNIQKLCTHYSYFPTSEDEPKLIVQLKDELAQIKCIFEKCLAKNVKATSITPNYALGSDLGSPLDEDSIEEASDESFEATPSEMSGLSSSDDTGATAPLSMRVALLEEEVSQLKSFIQGYPLPVTSIPDYTYNQSNFVISTVPNYNLEYAASIIPTVNDYAIDALLSPANYNFGYVATVPTSSYIYNPEAPLANYTVGYEGATTSLPTATNLVPNYEEYYYASQDTLYNVRAQEFPLNTDMSGVQQ